MAEVRDFGQSIPGTLEELTPEWLTIALGQTAPGVKVVSARAGAFLGHKPNKAIVHLQYDKAGEADGLPSTLFVKGGFKGEQRSKPSGIDIAVELEVMAYEHLLPKTDVTAPRSFFQRFDPKSYDGIMLLEDLSAAGATYPKERQTSLDYAQAAAFLDLQARFHAQWMDSPLFSAGELLGPGSRFDQGSRRLHEGYIDELVEPHYWDRWIKEPRGSAVPLKLHDAARMSAALKAMKAIHRETSQTIVHGDEHLGNLYIDAEGRAGLLDWCPRKESWVLGVTYFLLSCVDVLDRRNWEKPLLALYLDRLARYGGKAPDFREAWFLYRITTIFPFLIWLNNSNLYQPETVNTFNTMRCAFAIIDHDALELLGV